MPTTSARDRDAPVSMVVATSATNNMFEQSFNNNDSGTSTPKLNDDKHEPIDEEKMVNCTPMAVAPAAVCTQMCVEFGRIYWLV